MSVPSAWRSRRFSAAPLRIGIAGGSAGRATDLMNGATLGVEEAQHAAQMFGGTVTIVPVADELSATQGLAAVLGDGDEARCLALSRRAHDLGIPFMNVACASDRLRGADCQSTTFHVAPSDSMMRAAVAMAGGAGEASAWDASLMRFGADTLNQRFKKRFGTAMTADAWTSWFAVKVLWESALHTRSADPSKLTEFLGRDTTQFDGHKGRPLGFRTWDHQLRQPLYVRAGTKLSEVPEASGPDDSSRDVLDRLGVNAAQSACHFPRR